MEDKNHCGQTTKMNYQEKTPIKKSYYYLKSMGCEEIIFSNKIVITKTQNSIVKSIILSVIICIFIVESDVNY